ncbi:MAG: hypothetical protein ACSNEK_09620 [Parachlamydiaceae bacterium]
MLNEPHHPPYLQDSHLVFQFILSEFIKASEEARRLEPLIALYKQKNGENHCELVHSLTGLSGYSHNHGQIFPWTHAEGSLNKLTTLIHQYVQLSGESREVKEIQNVLDKSLKESKKALHLLKASEKDNSSVYVEDMIELHVIQALKSFRKLKKHLFPLLKLFRNNANVLFFLLKNQQALRNIYGKRVIVQFFKENCPEGHTSLEHFLLGEYTKRGFSQLAKNINDKMSELTL